MLQVAKLNKALESSSVQVGDVLRGVTCTNFVYEVCRTPATCCLSSFVECDQQYYLSLHHMGGI